MKEIALVFLGGGLGSALRFAISSLLVKNWLWNYSATVATISANVLASAILVFVWLGIDQGKFSPELKFLVLVGFCGGLSTFSTFSFETFQFLRQGQIWPAVLNVLVSVALCLAAIGLIYKSSPLPNQG